MKDQNGRDFKLSEQAGKKVLLSFHPLAWTSVCAEQMKSLEANKKTFDSLNTVAVGLSVDSVPTKKAWAKSLGIVDTENAGGLLAARRSCLSLRAVPGGRGIFPEGQCSCGRERKSGLRQGLSLAEAIASYRRGN